MTINQKVNNLCYDTVVDGERVVSWKYGGKREKSSRMNTFAAGME